MRKENFNMIPKSVMRNGALSPAARLLYGVIYTSTFNKRKECWATNAMLMEEIAASDRTITSLISELTEGGFIVVSGSTKARKITVPTPAENCGLLPQKTAAIKNPLPQNRVPTPAENCGSSPYMSFIDDNKMINTEKNSELGSEENQPKKTVPESAVIPLFPTYHPAEGASPKNPPPIAAVPPPVITAENAYWEGEKAKFLGNKIFAERFAVTRHIASAMIMQALLDEFVEEVELKEDYKSAKELQQHFYNWFKSNVRRQYLNPNGTSVKAKTHNQDEPGESSIPQPTARELETKRFLDDLDRERAKRHAGANAAGG